MLLPSFAASAAAAAFSSRSTLGSARAERSARTERSAVQACAVATDVSTADAAKIFGRLAEPNLHLDPTVGACCHSACSDCEWRDPEGGYRFDVLKSTQPKWVPVYRMRDFADERGAHAPRWAEALFPAGADSVDRASFAERLVAMDYSTAMGPKGIVRPEEAAPSPEAVDALWDFLAEGGSDTDLSFAAMRARLQAMSLAENREGAVGEGPDSLVWKEFALGMGCKPFDRF